MERAASRGHATSIMSRRTRLPVQRSARSPMSSPSRSHTDLGTPIHPRDHVPVEVEQGVRWTAYAGEYVAAHACCKEDAIELGRQKGWKVDSVVLRLRAYPFTHLRRDAVPDV